MTYIRNTEKKFFTDKEGNTVLNPYWEGLLNADTYIEGFLDGLEAIKPVIENAPEEIDDASETLAKIKKDIAGDVSEEILMQLGFLRNQAIISAIDSLDEEDWSKRCQNVLDNLSEEEKARQPIHPNDSDGSAIDEWE